MVVLLATYLLCGKCLSCKLCPLYYCDRFTFGTGRWSLCWPLTYYVVTAYHVNSVLSTSVIISLSEEGDGRFVVHLHIMWQRRIMLDLSYLLV